jgi:serine protease inhibitor
MISMMHMVNFKIAATAASQINGWVSNATSNKIKDIVTPESIQPGQKMMALNVVYFKGYSIHIL